MSQSYTHHWDEIEYFELAVPHAEKEPKVAGVKAGCNGCHAPFAFLAGDVPPPPPAEDSRANEGVSCDLCHTVTGFEGDVPFNFNWIVSPGKVKQGRPAQRRGEPPPRDRREPVPATGRVLRHLPQREGPLGPVGQVDPPGVEGGPARQGGHRLPGLPHAAGGRALRADGRGAPRHAPAPVPRRPRPGQARPASSRCASIPRPARSRRATPCKLTAVLVNAKAGHKIPPARPRSGCCGCTWRRWTRRATATTCRSTQGVRGRGVHHRLGDALAYQDIGDIKGHRRLPGPGAGRDRRARRATASSACPTSIPRDG